ncbi:MAG: U32 family peptidase [Erysipelotrichaceae bacterium]
MKRIELLAPCGDLNRLKIAVDMGADAVYLGGKSYSLRSRASNFTLEDIACGVQYAHNHHARVYVTVNMIYHDCDLAGLQEYLLQLETIGVDGIIVASIGVIKMAKAILTTMEVHVSTQLSVTNSLDLKFLEQLKVERVVLARELDLQQMSQTINSTNLEIEVFVHGGMCANYSGRCTLSNEMTNRDANRGGCAQSCRWKYHLYNKNNQELSPSDCLFSLSSKDLNALSFLPSLIDMGVSSLKIEGRMKSEYYLATLIKTYRLAIDEYYEKGLDSNRIEYYLNQLNKAENRPTANGFLDNKMNKDTHLYDINGAGVTHEFVGKIIDIVDDKIQIQVRNVFKVGDKLEFFGPITNNEQIVVEKIWDIDLNEIELANKPMSIVYIESDKSLQVGDFIRVTK